MTDPQAALRALLKQKSVLFGEFTLVSGAKSDFYVDSKMTTLDPRGADLIGALGWARLKEYVASHALSLDGVGGLTMGADPIALAVALRAYQEDQQTLQAYCIRKEPKGHGRGKQVEGDFKAGAQVAVIDDVITTGGSTLKAISAIREAGGHVAVALVLVDREEGGRAAIEAEGVPVIALFSKSQLRDD